MPRYSSATHRERHRESLRRWWAERRGVNEPSPELDPSPDFYDTLEWRRMDHEAAVREADEYCGRIQRGDIAGYWIRHPDGPSPADLRAKREADMAVVERHKAASRESYQRRKAAGKIKRYAPRPNRSHAKAWELPRGRGVGIEARSDLFHPCGHVIDGSDPPDLFSCSNTPPVDQLMSVPGVCSNRNDGWLSYCLKPARVWFGDTPRCEEHCFGAWERLAS